jgi:hypothetical protein
MSTGRVPGLLTRLARRHGLVRTPLRRTTDQIEAAVTVALAVLAVLVVPLATTIAMGTYQRELAQAAATAAPRTAVTAVLLTNAQLRPATSSSAHRVAPATAPARWQLPNGQQRSAPLWVGADRHAGDRVPIWIDQHGNRTDPPETPGHRIVNALIIGIDLMVGGWLLLGALWWTVCRVLSRINAAWWEVQWARTGPGWSHRSWQ